MFYKLPIEIILKIFSYLSPKDYQSIAGVNKDLINIALDNLTWKHLFILYFPNFFDLYNQRDTENWHNAFREVFVYAKEIYENLPLEVWQKLSKAITEKNIANYYTMLNFAVKTGLEDIVDLLLKKGEPTNHQNCLGGTPLLYACNNGYSNIVKLLLLKGASPNISLKNNDGELKQGENAWHAAIRLAATNYDQAQSIIQLLLDNNLSNLNNKYILHKYAAFAATQVSVAAVKLLISLCLKEELPYNPSDSMLIALAIMENISQDILKLLLPEKNSEKSDLVNLKNLYGATVLFFAIMNGCEHTVKELINYGASTNVVLTKRFNYSAYSAGFLIQKEFSKGETPWHTAVKLAETDSHKAKSILTLLASAQPEHIDVKNEENITPLILATKKGYPEIVAQLLERGALVDYQDEVGATALFYAVVNGHVSIVESLIQKGANTASPLNDGIYFSEVMYFRKGETPWHAAVGLAKTDLNKAMFILTLFASTQPKHIDAKDKTGATALFHAVVKNHVSIVELLIQKGANTASPLNDSYFSENMSFHYKETSWHAAVKLAETDLDKAKLILTFFASAQPKHIEAKDDAGITPLMLAAQTGCLEIITLLLELGAIVDCQDEADATALFYAVANGHVSIVESLIQKGAYTASPLNDSKHLSNDIYLYCEETPWHAAIRLAAKIDLNKAKFILTLFAKVQPEHIDAKDDAGTTPLMLAAQIGCLEIITLLLELGAIIDCQDKADATALFHAIANGHVSIVELLIQKGANTASPLNDNKYFFSTENMNFCQGQTPWHAAVKFAKIDLDKSKSIIKALLANHPEEINIKDREGMTSLTLAAKEGHVEIVELILAKNKMNNSYGSLLNTACQLLKNDCDSDIDKGKRIVQALWDKTKKNDNSFTTKKFFSLLKKQSENANIKILSLFPQIKESIDTINNDGETALFYAIRKKKNKLAILLLDHANPGTQIKEETLLHITTKQGNLELVNLLLKNQLKHHYTNPDERNSFDWTWKNIKDSDEKRPFDWACNNIKNSKDGGKPDKLAAKVKIKNLLKLLDYLEAVENREPNHYRNTLTVFGYQFNFGFSADQKRNAAEALIKVCLFNQESSSLKAHKSALKNGRLGHIYRSYKNTLHR